MKRDMLGLVLAGGRSSRMGADKATLEIREGLSQLEYLLGMLGKLCQETAVSLRQGQSLPSESSSFRVIEDPQGIEGPMAGALAALRASGGRPVLAIGCDMPFIDAPVILQLLSRREEEKAASCFLGRDGKPEPLCAIYEPRSLSLLEERAGKGQLSLRKFLMEENVERIRLARPRLLASVNTPEEADEARKQLGFDLQ